MLSLILYSVLSCSTPDVTTLVEAPETLRQPMTTEFVDKQYYLRALAMYSVCGHWSINDKFIPFPNF